MKFNIHRLRFQRNGKEGPCTGPCRGPDGTLRIDCSVCGRVPGPQNPECIRCMAAALSRYGRSDRILLRGARDTAISGPGADMLYRLSPMFPDLPCESGRCQGCECSPRQIFASVWEAFPEAGFEAPWGVLRRNPPKDGSCTVCMQRTAAALDAAESAYMRTADMASAVTGGDS